MERSADPLRYALISPIVAPPGTLRSLQRHDTRCSGDRAAGGEAAARLRARRALCSAGHHRLQWLGRLAGLPSAVGLRLRPRDLAKFGSLYLHDGQWNGHQVVPREWIAESTKRRLTFPQQQARGYAYLWWHACYPTRSGVVEVPTAVGNGMQRIFLLRAQRTVVTVLSGRYNQFGGNPPERLLLDYIMPALPPAAASPCPS
jgi:CubicO group peptidase (beta-lactamase class C family)